MALAREHTVFVMRELCPVDPQLLEIDREFTNLLALLKYDGYPITTGKRKFVTVSDLTEAVCRDDTLHFDGFGTHRDIIYKWLESDFLSLIHRNDPGKQQVAAPLPMHLNTYKLRNGKYNKDRGVADQIFRLLFHGAPGVMRDLRDFLFRGADFYSDQYDGHTDLDIETLLMMRILDGKERDYPDRRKEPNVPRPLCLGQAYILGDDIDRLLAYQDDVPRLVLIGYIKNVIALHMGIYMLRLFRIIPDLVTRGALHPTCLNCSVRADNPSQIATCPFPVYIATDMGENHRSHMAELARQQFTVHLEQLNTYVRAQLVLKKLQEFAEDLGKPLKAPNEILALREQADPAELKAFFKSRIRSLMATDDNEPDERLVTIRQLGLDDLDTYVEMIYLLRQGFHQKHHTQLLDSLFQKNRDVGLLRQGHGRANKRRYSLGSGLLETLVQIAVLESVPGGGFRTRTVRVDTFVEWLQGRYGIHISQLPADRGLSINDLEALRLNVKSFKDRLREIGFYTDLSDAYVAQIVRPRYFIEERVV